jgi:6,7-dimethyl-8-ribityllumazine synthase
VTESATPPGYPEDEPSVFQGWPSSLEEPALPRQPPDENEAPLIREPASAPEPEPEAQPEASQLVEPVVEEPPAVEEAASVPEPEPQPELVPFAEHAEGRLEIPPGYRILQGSPGGSRRGVGVVVSRFNGEITSLLLKSALDELALAGVGPDAITVMPVPGAFELPLGAMALAKTRRYACIVALGCVIRGETPHFEYVAGETASGLQLAALETGIPVAFGVLTTENADQAHDRVGKGAEAVRTALEMADLFSQLRTSAAGAQAQ